MVSLNRRTNSLNEDEPDVQGLLQPVVVEEKLKEFTSLNTVIPAVLLLTLAVIMEIIVLIFTFSSKNTEKQCEPYFITLYTHLVYWAFSFIFHFHSNKKHNESRLNGYLDFYQESHYHSQIPFYITSLWNTILLLLSTLFHDRYHDLEPRCQSNEFLTPINFSCFIITVENVFMVPTIIFYIYKVFKFNKSQPCPDVQRDEWVAGVVQSGYSRGEVGYREQDDHMEELLEKQADMLLCLKEQNFRLAKKVLTLNALLKTESELLHC